VHRDFLDRFAQVRDRLPKLERVVVVGGDDVAWTTSPGRRRLDDAPADGADDASIQPTDLMLVMYTAGTTGLPKGVVIPQRQIISGALLLSLEGGSASKRRRGRRLGPRRGRLRAAPLVSPP